ncbi:snoRNA-binding protein [Pestalotiopsis sp. IQ-011]
MEVVAGIGACWAIFQIAGAFLKLTQKGDRAIRGIQAAPHDFEVLVEETTLFTTLLTAFGEVLRKIEDSGDVRRESKMKDAIRYIRRQCKSILRDVRKFIEQFNNVHEGQASTVRVYLARMIWVLRKPDTRELRLRMNSTKFSMSLLVGLYRLEVESSKKTADERLIQIYRDTIHAERKAANRVKRELRLLQEQRRSPDVWICTEGGTEIQRFVVKEANATIRQKFRPMSERHPSTTEVLEREAATSPPRPFPRHPPPPPPPGQMSAPRVAADTRENKGEVQPRSHPDAPRPEAEESEDEHAAEAPTSGPFVQSRWQPVPPFDGKAPKLWRRTTPPSEGGPDGGH